MIVFLTNADTEILAIRSIVESLPDGFAPVRAANPSTGLVPSIEPGDVVLVRLLGGRREEYRPLQAWTETANIASLGSSTADAPGAADRCTIGNFGPSWMAERSGESSRSRWR